MLLIGLTFWTFRIELGEGRQNINDESKMCERRDRGDEKEGGADLNLEILSPLPFMCSVPVLKSQIARNENVVQYLLRQPNHNPVMHNLKYSYFKILSSLITVDTKSADSEYVQKTCSGGTGAYLRALGVRQGPILDE